MDSILAAAPSGTRLYVQHHGNMHLDARRLAGVPAYFQSASKRTPPDAWQPCPCLTFVIRHPQGVALFDVGCSEEWMSEWGKTGISELVPYDDWTPEQQLEPTLVRIGLQVSDIDVVIASHLHMDHCGKLALFQRSGIDVILQQAEFDGAMAIEPPGLAAYVTSQYRNLDVRWRLINGDLDLMQGVRILSLPGHSYGTQGVAIRLIESGLFVLASDAAHVRASLAEPPIGSPNTYDSVSWRQSIRRLQRMRDEQAATIVCGHEPAQLQELKFSPNYYT